MDKFAKNLRRTRADMLGTDDEEHYWHCHQAADEIERLKEREDIEAHGAVYWHSQAIYWMEKYMELEGKDATTKDISDPPF